NKKAFVTLTPVLVNANGEELEFDSKSFKGEKAAGNGEVVKAGGHAFSYKSTKPYDPAFDNSKLIVKYVVTKGGKEKLNDKTPSIADALIITPKLVQNDDKVAMGDDNLVRSFKKSTKAVINYDKAKYLVKKNEKTDTDIIALQGFITSAVANPKIIINQIDILAYASPEGEIAKNANLADDRAESARAFMMTAIPELVGNESFIAKLPKGEDWTGLKELISKSSHEDKNIIISVAEMENDPAKREEEIKALSTTYKFLDDEIFPQLRRSQIVVNYTESGLTDDELKAAASSNPQSLSVEELMFTANKLVTDKDAKLAIYKEVIKKDAADWRGYTNAGVILYNKGEVKQAHDMFTKAYSAEKNAITSNNMGVVKRQNGDISEAVKMFNSASSTGDIANYNLGLINIKKGEYSTAVTNMGDSKTFNKALAQTLNKDYNTALKTIKDSPDSESAIGLYLKAIIAARVGNDSEVISYLSKSIAKDSTMRAKAKKDREFVKYFENTAFTAL
ncbi:MAG: hypothetical protein ACPGVD_04130, partial [Flavobacteriales bacterium]